jgi:hypothetical protein
MIILGAGYTGRRVFDLLHHRGCPVAATSRRPDAHLQFAPPTQRVEFDLAAPTTWQNLPATDSFVWCFPARPVEQVRTFMRSLLLAPRRLIVLGSTSSYDRPEDETQGRPAWLDESTRVNNALPRVQGEEYLRIHHGAIVLRVTGVYGCGRDPVEWIRAGRVQRSKKFVNLIHVEDVAEAVLCLLNAGTGGEVYNVSDGTPRTWSEIADEVERRWGVSPGHSVAEPRPGKWISTEKLRALGWRPQHPNLYEALAAIHGRDCASKKGMSA